MNFIQYTYIKHFRRNPKRVFDESKFNITVKYLEGIQLKEMKFIGYEKDGYRLSNEVRYADFGEENYRILETKYGVNKDDLKPVLIESQFVNLLWPYSRFESPYSISVLIPILDAIRTYKDNYKISEHEIIIIGTLAKGDLESSIKKYDNSGYIVLFNEGAITLFYTIAKAICLLVPVHNEKIKFSNLKVFQDNLEKKFIEAYGRFSEVMEAYLNERNAQSSKIYLQEEKYMDYVSEVTSVGSGFIVAHEFGHFYKNHFKKKTTKRMETQADSTAFDIIFSGFKDTSTLYKYLGIEFSILLSESIQKISNIKTNETHPTFDHRMKKLRIKLFKKLKWNEFKEVLYYADLQKDAFRNITKVFIDTNEFYKEINSH